MKEGGEEYGLDARHLEFEIERLATNNSDYISSVSHEMKTSISTIKVFADLMLTEADPFDRDTSTQYLSIIKAEADRLNHTVGRAADFYRFSQNICKWNEIKTDIADVIIRCVKAFQVLAEAKGIAFSVTKQANKMVVTIDPERVQRLLWCLFENALKDTQHGNIELTVGSEDVGTKTVLYILMADTGVGISADRMQKLRESGVDCLGSEGEGLYVVGKIVDHYQGKLVIDSQQDLGTSVCVELSLC